MRLAAVYFLADERFNNHTYNFGGCFSYKVHYSDNTLKIERKKNDLYVENFFNSEKITSISTIVGENGSGKTTLFKALKDAGSNCVLIYEKDEINQFVYHTNSEDFNPFYKSNELKLFKLEFKSEFVAFNNYNSSSFLQEDTSETISFKVQKLYYFPNSVYDQQLNKIDDFVVKRHKNNLATIKSLTLSKQIRFLSDQILVNKIRESYYEFPSYDSITITSSGVFMRDFKYHDIRKYAIENDLNDYEAEEKAKLNKVDLSGVFFHLNQIYDRSNQTKFKIFISIYYRLIYFFINNSNYSLVKVIGKLDELLERHLNYFKEEKEKDKSSIIEELLECFSTGVKFESTDKNDPESVKKILTNFLIYINIVTEKTDLKNRDFAQLTDFIFAYYELFDFFDKNIKSTNSKLENDVSFLKFDSGKNLSTGEISLLNFSHLFISIKMKIEQNFTIKNY